MIAELLPKIAGMEAEEKNFYPRPSSAGPERCIRQMVYHGLGIARQPLPGRAILVLDDSSWHEELTRDWIAKTVFKIHSQQMPVSCRHPMTEGHIDGIITDVLGIDRVLEHKALNHFTFNRFWEGNEMPLDYLTQLAIYIEAAQKDNPNITEGILLVKNKNTAQYIEYLCSYDNANDTLAANVITSSTGETKQINFIIENVVQAACDKFSLALDYISKKTIPKRQYDINHWRCQYCQWEKPCWESYAEEFDAMIEDAQMSEEIATMIRYYRELGGQKKDIEKEYDSIRAKLKEEMDRLGIRKGRAGEYLVERKLVSGSRLDKSLIPESILEAASTPYQQEHINIRTIKNGKGEE